MKEETTAVDSTRPGLFQKYSRLNGPRDFLRMAGCIKGYSSSPMPDELAQALSGFGTCFFAFHSKMTKFINPLTFLLPLYNDTMNYKIIYPLEERNYNYSRYCARQAVAPMDPYGTSSHWPQNKYFEKFKLDAALLKEALSAYAGPPEATLAERVFGSQARQRKIELRHLANILYERALLHKKRLRDINHRLTDFLDRLSVFKMHFPLDGGRTQQQLEKLIVELERQRHEEETSFWKDSVEIRHQLFDSAATYGSAQHRKDMLYGVEGKNV